MKPLQIRLAILLFGAGAAVVGVAGFRDTKSSALRAYPDPQVKVQEDERAINLAAAEKGEGGTKAPSALQAFMERITKAKAALAYIQGLNLDGGSFPFNVVKSLISSWAEKDFPAAKAWVEGLPPGTNRRRSAMVDLAFALAQKDPAAALSLARSLPGDDGQRFLIGALNGWCLKDAEAAIAYAVQLPDDGDFTLVYMFDKIASKDPDKAIKLLEQIPSENKQNEALRKIGFRWAISDPNAALDLANQQTDPKVKSEILKGVIDGMAQKNPERALELAQSLPANEREGRIDYILTVLSESDPEGAVGYAMNLPSNKFTNMTISRLAGQWISSDPQGALAWYGSLTDPKLKEQVARNMIDNLSKDDLAKSLDLLDTMPPGFFQNQALSRIGRNWAQTDQNAALDWANVQTDPEVKFEILQGVIEGMSVRDPNSAFQLVQSLPAGNSQNSIIITSLGSMAQSDPRSAISLASGIANADDRSKAQQNVVRRWKRSDPAAATQWINSSSLPQDVKARLLQQE
jgi:thioredoxin-like negative regulator of GroEL